MSRGRLQGRGDSGHTDDKRSMETHHQFGGLQALAVPPVYLLEFPFLGLQRAAAFGPECAAAAGGERGGRANPLRPEPRVVFSPQPHPSWLSFFCFGGKPAAYGSCEARDQTQATAVTTPDPPQPTGSPKKPSVSFFSFWGCTPAHGGPRLGVELELQPPACVTATAAPDP